MKKTEYFKAIAEALKEEGISASLREVPKNNVVLTGLSVWEEGSNISPTIYLDEFYKREMLIAEAVDEVKRIYEAHKNPDFINADINAFMTVDNLFVKVVSADNEAFLSDTIYRKWLDLAIVAYVRIAEGAVIKLTKDLYRHYFGSMTETEVINKAVSNKAEYDIVDIQTMLIELMTARGMTEDRAREIVCECDEEHKFYVATNKERVNGANILVSGKDDIRKLADSLNVNLWIIPSSVHEVLLLPHNEVFTEADSLKNMCVSVNASEVAPEDKLSDTIYYYDRNTNEITIAE